MQMYGCFSQKPPDDVGSMLKLKQLSCIPTVPILDFKSRGGMKEREGVYLNSFYLFRPPLVSFSRVRRARRLKYYYENYIYFKKLQMCIPYFIRKK